jgi:hypothetical protein
MHDRLSTGPLGETGFQLFQKGAAAFAGEARDLGISQARDSLYRAGGADSPHLKWSRLRMKIPSLTVKAFFWFWHIATIEIR